MGAVQVAVIAATTDTFSFYVAEGIARVEPDGRVPKGMVYRDGERPNAGRREYESGP